MRRFRQGEEAHADPIEEKLVSEAKAEDSEVRLNPTPMSHFEWQTLLVNSVFIPKSAH